MEKPVFSDDEDIDKSDAEDSEDHDNVDDGHAEDSESDGGENDKKPENDPGRKEHEKPGIFLNYFWKLKINGCRKYFDKFRDVLPQAKETGIGCIEEKATPFWPEREDLRRVFEGILRAGFRGCYRCDFYSKKT